MTERTGVLIEQQNGTIKENTLGMIALAKKDGREISAIVLEASGTMLKEQLSSSGISQIICVKFPDDKSQPPDTRAKVIIKTMEKFSIKIFIGLSSPLNKDLLPRIAALLEAPLAMECLDVDLKTNTAKITQYSGKILATVKLTGDTLIFGVNPNAAPTKKYNEKATLVDVNAPSIDSKGIRLIKRKNQNKIAEGSLLEANVIISGGRGMLKADNFTLLFECAEKLNATVGASRAAVDSGWVPYAMQVGQTGEKVGPKVYIACGISGSVQHLAGMQTSGTVIAINTDKNAPIISKSDYYVIADALQIVPQITTLLKNKKDRP